MLFYTSTAVFYEENVVLHYIYLEAITLLVAIKMKYK